MDPWERIGISAAKLLEAFRADTLRQTWVADDEGGISGVIAFRTRCALDVLVQRGATDLLTKEFGDAAFPEAGYIHVLAVFAGREGTGLGKALLDFAESAVAGESSLNFLFVTDFNTRAQAFYEKKGYRFIGAVENCLRAGNTEHLMMKQLR